MMNEQPVEELDVPACLALMRSVPVSRLAVCTAAGPDIFPVNHVVDHGSLVVRTAPGTKLTAATTEGAIVAVEADGYDDSCGQAWSVVVRGRAREVAGLHELLELEHLELAPWHAGAKNRFLRIEPDAVSGRRFPVADPRFWDTALTHQRRTPLE